MSKETDALLKIARERENKKRSSGLPEIKRDWRRKNLFRSTGHFRQNGKTTFTVGRRYTVSAERIRVRLARPQSNVTH